MIIAMRVTEVLLFAHFCNNLFYSGNVYNLAHLVVDIVEFEWSFWPLSVMMLCQEH